MKKYFFALSHPSKLKSCSKCIKCNVYQQMCVCFENMFSAHLFNASIFLHFDLSEP